MTYYMPDFTAAGVLKFLSDHPGLMISNADLSKRFHVSTPSMKLITGKLHAHGKVKTGTVRRSKAFYVPSDDELKLEPKIRNAFRPPLKGYESKMRQFADVCVSSR